jgi:hypothetical protein
MGDVICTGQLLRIDDGIKILDTLLQSQLCYIAQINIGGLSYDQ